MQDSFWFISHPLSHVVNQNILHSRTLKKEERGGQINQVEEEGKQN
jgi:hypothetical protein